MTPRPRRVETPRAETRDDLLEQVREAWTLLEGKGLRIGQVPCFPLDVVGTYAKLVHLPRRGRFYLQLVTGLRPQELLHLLRCVQLQLNEPSARWVYQPEQRHRGIQEQRVCAYTSGAEPIARLIGTMAERR